MCGLGFVSSCLNGVCIAPHPSPPILDLQINPQNGAGFGYSIAVGDLNGDQHDEIVVGVPFYDEGSDGAILNDLGRVYVYNGAGGCLLKVIQYPGTGLGAKFGTSVAIGDFNGDGFKDIIVGAPEDDTATNEDVGKVYVFFGPAFATFLAIEKPGPGQDLANFGFAVAAGDTDGDGFAEIVVGAPGEDVGAATNQGKAYHIKYEAGSSTSVVSTELNPGVSQTNLFFGTAVAIGDITGDGRGDPIVGAPGFNVGASTEVGAVYYFDLTMPFPYNPVSVVKPGTPEGGAHFGSALAAGKVYGDPNVDMIVGAPDESFKPLYNNIGIVYVIDRTGLKRGFISPNWFDDGGRFGSSVAVGDIDHDGLLDVIVGAPFELVNALANSGRIYVFHSNFGYAVDGALLTQAVIEHFSGNLNSVTEALFTGGNNNGTCEAGETCFTVTGYHNGQTNANFGWSVGAGNIDAGPGPGNIAAGAVGLDHNGVQAVGRAYLFIENQPPSAPTGLTPNSAVLAIKSGTLQTDGVFVDPDVAIPPVPPNLQCMSPDVWTDLHTLTEWRISKTSAADCIAMGVGVVYNQVLGPPNLSQTPVIDLVPLGFGYGNTVFWCARYKDTIDFGGWSTASFAIGSPDPEIPNAVDIDPNSPFAPITFTASSVDFRTVSCLDQRTADITVKNTGTAIAPVTAVGLLAGANFKLVSVTPPTPFDLAPGESFVARVTFTPPGVGVFGDTLRVTYGDPITVSFALTGASVAPTGSVIPVSPPPINLGTFTIGDPPVTSDVTVSETSGATYLLVSSVVLATTDKFDWAWADTEDKTLPRVVPAAGSRIIRVTFNPLPGSGCGLKTATLSVTHDGGCVATTTNTVFNATVVGPDLTGVWVRFNSSDEGQTVRGVLRIQNVGTLTTTKPFRVKFFLSADTTLDASDALVGQQDIGFSFNPGAVKNIGFNYSPEASVSGQFIIAVIDTGIPANKRYGDIMECNDFDITTQLPTAFPFPSNNVVIPIRFGAPFAIP